MCRCSRGVEIVVWLEYGWTALEILKRFHVQSQWWHSVECIHLSGQKVVDPKRVWWLLSSLKWQRGYLVEHWELCIDEKSVQCFRCEVLKEKWADEEYNAMIWFVNTSIFYLDIIIVSWKSTYGRSTVQVCQTGGYALFGVFWHLTTKERPCHVFRDLMPLKQIIGQMIMYNGITTDFEVKSGQHPTLWTAPCHMSMVYTARSVHCITIYAKTPWGNKICIVCEAVLLKLHMNSLQCGRSFE